MRTFRNVVGLVFLLAAGVLAHADTANVNCQAKKDNSINAALGSLTKQGPHTVNISGTCTEAVVIDHFDDVSLVGTPGASINLPADPTGATTVISVTNSRNVQVHDITVNGGGNGISCFLFSDCAIYNITVQGAAGVGVVFARSTGVVGDNAIVQNNGIGVEAIRNSHVRIGAFPANGGATITNNGNPTDGGIGVLIDDASYVDMFFSTVSNTVAGSGVHMQFASFLGVFDSHIVNNQDQGIFAGPQSTVRFRGGSTGNFVTGNAGAGITLSHLTFLQVGGIRTISGNGGGTDVVCAKQTAKTQGTTNLGGGTTNCVEPAP